VFSQGNHGGGFICTIRWPNPQFASFLDHFWGVITNFAFNKAVPHAFEQICSAIVTQKLANRVLAIRFVQWWGWVFETQGRKKEKLEVMMIVAFITGNSDFSPVIRLGLWNPRKKERTQYGIILCEGSDSEELNPRNKILPPPPYVVYSRNWYSFSMLKLTKFPPPYGGGLTFYYTSHDMNRFIPHVHRARPLNGFENGANLAENRIEYVLLTTWDGNSIFSSANRTRPGSQKLPFNGFTEWNFLRNKEKAYQNRKYITLGGGG